MNNTARTQSETRALNAVGQLCEAAMLGFAEASHRGELAKAKAKLGNNNFATAGSEALKRHMKRVLIRERTERERELSVPGLGGLAAQAALADVIASAAADVVAAASKVPAVKPKASKGICPRIEISKRGPVRVLADWPGRQAGVKRYAREHGSAGYLRADGAYRAYWLDYSTGRLRQQTHKSCRPVWV